MGYVYLLTRTMVCTQISIRATALTYDISSASKSRSFWRIQKSQKSRSNVFCLPVDFQTFRQKFDCCDAAINIFTVQQQQNKKTKNKTNFHRGHHLQKLLGNVKKHLLTYHCLSRVRVFVYMNIKLFYENTLNKKRNTH